MEPEHEDDTPLRPVEDAMETRTDPESGDVVVDDEIDFTDQPLSTDAIEIVENSDGGDVFFAPTDPVLRAGADGQPEVLGGFSPTADIPEPARSSDGRIGDEAIADAVRDALALDASTADLTLTVDVAGAVVRLRGTVDSIEDGENAEAVASAVSGVTEAIDETEIAG
ncbi:MAG: BON domain-containing protein [Chloroflexota bacterium]|nr:BON domain-containing protein [Chloroflexota bacterium]